jgi:hypothetical protein
MNYQQEQIIQAYKDFSRKVESIMGKATPVSISIYDVPTSAFSDAAESRDADSGKWMMESIAERITLFSQINKPSQS